jgi:hypothetical protein
MLHVRLGAETSCATGLTRIFEAGSGVKVDQTMTIHLSGDHHCVQSNHILRFLKKRASLDRSALVFVQFLLLAFRDVIAAVAPRFGSLLLPLRGKFLDYTCLRKEMYVRGNCATPCSYPQRQPCFSPIVVHRKSAGRWLLNCHLLVGLMLWEIIEQ